MTDITVSRLIRKVDAFLFCLITGLTSIIRIRYTYTVKITYSDDGIGRDYSSSFEHVAPKGIAQETLRQKDRYPTKLRKAGFIRHRRGNFAIRHIIWIAEESFRFRYGARDFVRASCFFVLRIGRTHIFRCGRCFPLTVLSILIWRKEL